jgi:NTP pyrophosphatase (non-canonical NTP hydrolase)
MTRTEHLLTILAEECAEVAQRASKAARFGMSEVQPGQELSNASRLAYEMTDLIAVYLMLTGFTGIDCESPGVREKRAKVEQFLAYSAECGTVS